MKVLLDTSIFVDCLRGQQIAKEFLKKIKVDEVYYSAITEAELFSHHTCKDLNTVEKIKKLLSIGVKIHVNNEIAILGGSIRREHSIPLDDALISATAIFKNAKLYSKNAEHFKRIKSLNFEEPY